MNDAHSDLTVMCYAKRGEINEYGNEEVCDTKLNYEDHFSGMVHKQDWEGKGLRLVCPECGQNHTVCPVCHGGGWYRGESTGKSLACHVCNSREHERQRQQEMGLR